MSEFIYLRHPIATARLFSLRQWLRAKSTTDVPSGSFAKSVNADALAAMLAGELPRLPSSSNFEADLVVPVHGNPKDLKRMLACLEQCLSFHSGRIVFVDDGSPDTITIDILQHFVREHAKAELIRNETPQGVGVALNTGITRCSAETVAILNTDVRFSPAALARLCRPLGDGIATRTPLTSNGFLCGLGHRATGFDVFFKSDEAVLDAVCFALAKTTTVPVPVGTGFAMALNRDAFNEVDGFDTSTIGYGEDTRLSLMLSARGWTHELAIDTFISHRGAGSFGASRRRLIRQASLKIVRDFSEFSGAIKAYLVADPAAAHSLAAMQVLAVHYPDTVQSISPNNVFEVADQTVSFHP